MTTTPGHAPHLNIVTADSVARVIVRRERNVKPGSRYRFTHADFERIAIVRHTLEDIARGVDFDPDNLVGGQAVELIDLFHETDGVRA